MSGLLRAIGFLTVLPVPRRSSGGFSPAMIIFFPLVGLLIGALLAGADLLLAGFEPSLRSILLLGLWVLVTGALHLDGWIDACDALAPGLSPDAARRALRDPRAGAMGVAGAVLLIGTKWAALSSIGDGRALWIVVAATTSRWATSVVVVAMPAAGARRGLGSRVREGASGSRAAASTVWVLSLFLIAPLPWLATTMLAALASVGLVAFMVRRRLSELPGDAYGAGLELAEAVVLVCGAYGGLA